jgi:hypothetical protein
MNSLKVLFMECKDFLFGHIKSHCEKTTISITGVITIILSCIGHL